MTVKQQYEKERKRLQQFARRAEKRGYMTEEGATPASLIPQRPKTITAASVRRLQKLTADKMYDKLVAVDWDTKTEKARGRQALRKLEYEARKAARKVSVEIKEDSAVAHYAQIIAENIKADLEDTPDLPEIIAENVKADLEDAKNLVSDILGREDETPDMPAGMVADQKTGAVWDNVPQPTFSSEKLIINNLETSIQNMHSGATPILLKILYSALHQVGEKALGAYIEEHASEINDTIRRYAEAYGDQAVSAAAYDFLDIMSGAYSQHIDKETYISGWQEMYPEIFLGGYGIESEDE